MVNPLSTRCVEYRLLHLSNIEHATKKHSTSFPYCTDTDTHKHT